MWRFRARLLFQQVATLIPCNDAAHGEQPPAESVRLTFPAPAQNSDPARVLPGERVGRCPRESITPLKGAAPMWHTFTASLVRFRTLGAILALGLCSVPALAGSGGNV